MLWFALWQEDKQFLATLPHFIWVGILLFMLRLMYNYRSWAKEQLIQEMVYGREGITNDVDNSALNTYRRQFRMFDRDLNGAISVQELMRVMEQHGRSIRKEELKQRLHVIDDDDDKEISFSEFVNLMEGLQDVHQLHEEVRVTCVRPQSRRLIASDVS